VPASYADSFAMLARHRIIEPRLATALASMVALRNRLAHGYGTADLDRIWSELPVGLTALEQFAAAIAMTLAPAT
jgi:uncharacterized protein YutE (UPF0331/DUF86 family)